MYISSSSLLRHQLAHSLFTPTKLQTYFFTFLYIDFAFHHVFMMQNTAKHKENHIDIKTNIMNLPKNKKKDNNEM